MRVLMPAESIKLQRERDTWMTTAFRRDKELRQLQLENAALKAEIDKIREDREKELDDKVICVGILK